MSGAADTPSANHGTCAELFPSREALAGIEEAVTRLQRGCEDLGLWPGALSLKEARDSQTRLEARGLAVAVMRENTDVLFDVRFRDCGQGWPHTWFNDIHRTLTSLDEVVRRLLRIWPGTKTNAMALVFGMMFQTKANDPNHLGSGDERLTAIRNYTPNPWMIPVEVAAVIERCAQRLRTILADGPKVPLGTNVAVAQPIKAARHGRPRDPHRAAIVELTERYLETGMTYKEITPLINVKFGRSYKQSTLEDYVKDARSARKDRGKKGGE